MLDGLYSSEGPVAALVYLAPTLVWLIIAEDAWRFRLLYRPRSPFYRILPVCTTSFAAFYGLEILISLALPLGTGERPPRWFDLTDVATTAGLASFRHLAWYYRLRPERPSRTWLAANYGVAALVAAINLFPEVIPAPNLAMQFALARATILPFVIVMLVLIFRHLSRFAQPGTWRPGGNEARFADLAVVTMALLLVILLVVYYSRNMPPADGQVSFVPAPPLLNAGIGLLVALPFVARILGDVVKRFLTASALLVGTACGFFAIQAVVASRLDPGLRTPATLAGIGALVLGLFYVQPAIGELIDLVLFRRSERRRNELQQAVHELSPELGVRECARLAIEAFVRIMRIRGAALLLSRGRGAVSSGRIAVEPLERIWQDGAALERLPRRPFSLGTFRSLPTAMQSALAESEVVGVVPVSSFKQRWGAAFITTGPLGTAFSEVDRQAIQGLVDQLAVLLDGAELLERTIAVERNLAHAEKLATIGELAAQVAHDIRNPVTAARSLAQLLARESASTPQAEHAELILTELDRVERQIADLLRFARRDELRCEAVDLAELVRQTVDEFRVRLAERSIGVELDASREVVAQADRERLRQALINLIENSIDALSSANGNRRLSVSVEENGAHSTIRIADNGPGVPPEKLPQIFEPFFSLKSNGTGLGLAIVKRTIEAHGGKVSANGTPGGGLSLHLELPGATEPVEPR